MRSDLAVASQTAPGWGTVEMCAPGLGGFYCVAGWAAPVLPVSPGDPGLEQPLSPASVLVRPLPASSFAGRDRTVSFHSCSSWCADTCAQWENLQLCLHLAPVGSP